MIRVRLFAALKEMAGTEEISVPSGQGTVFELLGFIIRTYPSLAEIIESGGVLVSVNMEFAGREAPVRDGDEVGLMPPFSGGGPCLEGE